MPIAIGVGHAATPSLAAGSHPPACGYDADIIILTRNRFAETIEAVESALRQRNVAVHVSLLDQGSEPAMQAKFAAAFAGCRNLGYYVSAGNLGVGGGRNFLSGLGSGSVIVALDNDAVFADDRVAANAVGWFAESPGLGVVGFRILAPDGIALDHFSWGYPAGLKSRAQGDFQTTTFVGAGHAIRRDTWIGAGGYDADLFFTWEEYDFSLRAIALGWSIAYAGSLAVIHKVSPEARLRWQSERMRFFVRNRLTVARKWNISWAALLPRIGGYLIKAARNRRLLPAVSGLRDAIRLDHCLFKRHMPPQMRRYIRDHELRHRDNVILSFYRHAIVQMPAEPE